MQPVTVRAVAEKLRTRRLSGLAKTMIEKRGRLDDEDVDRLLAAGFGKDHALEVIAAVAASTITNYTGSLTKTPLEAPFQAHAWVGWNPGAREMIRRTPITAGAAALPAEAAFMPGSDAGPEDRDAERPLFWLNTVTEFRLG